MHTAVATTEAQNFNPELIGRREIYDNDFEDESWIENEQSPTNGTEDEDENGFVKTEADVAGTVDMLNKELLVNDTVFETGDRILTGEIIDGVLLAYGSKSIDLITRREVMDTENGVSYEALYYANGEGEWYLVVREVETAHDAEHEPDEETISTERSKSVSAAIVKATAPTAESPVSASAAAKEEVSSYIAAEDTSPESREFFFFNAESSQEDEAVITEVASVNDVVESVRLEEVAETPETLTTPLAPIEELPPEFIAGEFPTLEIVEQATELEEATAYEFTLPTIESGISISVAPEEITAPVEYTESYDELTSEFDVVSAMRFEAPLIVEPISAVVSAPVIIPTPTLKPVVKPESGITVAVAAEPRNESIVPEPAPITPSLQTTITVQRPVKAVTQKRAVALPVDSINPVPQAPPPSPPASPTSPPRPGSFTQESPRELTEVIESVTIAEPQKDDTSGQTTPPPVTTAPALQATTPVKQENPISLSFPLPTESMPPTIIEASILERAEPTTIETPETVAIDLPAVEAIVETIEETEPLPPPVAIKVETLTPPSAETEEVPSIIAVEPVVAAEPVVAREPAIANTMRHLESTIVASQANPPTIIHKRKTVPLTTRTKKRASLPQRPAITISLDPTRQYDEAPAPVAIAA